MLLLALTALLATEIDEAAAKARAEAIARRSSYDVVTVTSSRWDAELEAFYVVVEGTETKRTTLTKSGALYVWVAKDGTTFHVEDWSFQNQQFASRTSRDVRWEATLPILAADQPKLAPESQHAPKRVPRGKAVLRATRVMSERYRMREIVVLRADWEETSKSWIVALNGRTPEGCWTYQLDLKDAGVESAGGRGSGSSPSCLALEEDDWTDPSGDWDRDESPREPIVLASLPEPIGIDDARERAEAVATTRHLTSATIVKTTWENGWLFTIEGRNSAGLSTELEVHVARNGLTKLRCEASLGGAPAPDAIPKKSAEHVGREAVWFRGLLGSSVTTEYRERRCADATSADWIVTASGEDSHGYLITLKIDVEAASGWARTIEEDSSRRASASSSGQTFLERIGPRKEKPPSYRPPLEQLGFGTRRNMRLRPFFVDEPHGTWAEGSDPRFEKLAKTGADRVAPPAAAAKAIGSAKERLVKAGLRDVRLVAAEHQEGTWRVDFSARVPHGCARTRLHVAEKGDILAIDAKRTLRRTWIDRCERWNEGNVISLELYPRREPPRWLSIEIDRPSSISRKVAEREAARLAEENGLREVKIVDATFEDDAAWEIEGIARRDDRRCVFFYVSLEPGAKPEIEIDGDDASPPGADCTKWSEDGTDENENKDWSDY